MVESSTVGRVFGGPSPRASTQALVDEARREPGLTRRAQEVGAGMSPRKWWRWSPLRRLLAPKPQPGELVTHGETGLTAADHEHVQWRTVAGCGGHRTGSGVRATLKLNIMPLSACSAMWQCAIHSPGL
jgi:hypothetical protein